MVMHAHTCPSGQPLGIPIRRASNGHHSQVHIKLKKSHSPPSSLGSDLLLFKYLDLFVELEGVKTISCNMVRLNTFDSMETKKDDTLKKGKTNPPKDDGYDYEVPDWMKNEWIMVRYRCYKDWIS